MKKNKIIILLILFLVILITSIIIFTKKDKKETTNTIIENRNTQIIEGTYSDIKVTDYKSAEESIESIKDVIDIKNLELEEDSIIKNDYLIIYKFKQKYKGITIYDSYLMVYTDLDGTIHGLHNNLKNIDTEVKEKSSQDKLNNIIDGIVKEYSVKDYHLLQNELLLYPVDDKYILTHYYEIDLGYVTIEVVIRDDNNEILVKEANISNITNEELSNSHLDSFKIGNNSYILKDKDRNIIGRYLIKMEDGQYEVHDYEWGTLEEARAIGVVNILDHFNNIKYLYDYYQNKYNKKGFNNTDEQIELWYGLKSTVFSNYSNNAFYSPPNTIIFGEDMNPSIEITAHEYTHGIFRHNVENRIKTDYTSIQEAAIDEAYADIMGMIIEAKYNNNDKIDGLIDEVNRDIKKSKITYDTFEKNGYSAIYHDEHEYSLIISKVAYETSQFLSMPTFEKLWFNSMFLLDGTDITFFDCKYAVLRQAEIMNLPEDTIKRIEKEFENVGLIQAKDINNKIIKYQEKKWPLYKEETEKTEINYKNRENKEISAEDAQKILINNYGNKWQNIPLTYQYVSKIKNDDNDYYVIIQYANSNIGNYGGEWLTEAENGKYYMTTFFVGTKIDENEKIVCNFVKDYDGTKKLKNGSAYSRYIFDGYCDI